MLTHKSSGYRYNQDVASVLKFLNLSSAYQRVVMRANIFAASDIEHPAIMILPDMIINRTKINERSALNFLPLSTVRRRRRIVAAQSSTSSDDGTTSRPAYFANFVSDCFVDDERNLQQHINTVGRCFQVKLFHRIYKH